jgi:hypothetical protein
MPFRSWVALVAVASSVACSDSATDLVGGASSTSSASGAAGHGGAGGEGGSPFSTGGSAGVGGDSCVPPDMIIALDRTLTMHFQPNGSEPTDAPEYASSKWSQAINAIEGLVQPPIDGTIRFGLELWPKESPGCITLAERVENTVQATNPFCEEGEVLLSPALDQGSAVDAALDPATTKICVSTPTGSGLLTASARLAEIQEAGRDQFILLVTDGADWDASCPTPDPLATVQTLAGAGVKTFILGFSASGELMPNGIGAPFLNNMACAGLTAPDFDVTCMMSGAGFVAVDPEGPTLYLQASDGAALATALQAVAAQVCCDCIE